LSADNRLKSGGSETGFKPAAWRGSTTVPVSVNLLAEVDRNFDKPFFDNTTIVMVLHSMVVSCRDVVVSYFPLAHWLSVSQ
jgi:hypothetical protein